MAFSVRYSENIWSNGERDVEVVYSNELIYMVKEFKLVRGWFVNNQVFF